MITQVLSSKVLCLICCVLTRSKMKENLWRSPCVNNDDVCVPAIEVLAKDLILRRNQPLKIQREIGLAVMAMTDFSTGQPMMDGGDR